MESRTERRVELDRPLGSVRPDPPSIHALVAYQDLVTGLRAKRAFDLLSSLLNDEFSFRCSLWRLDVLKTPGMRDQARVASVQADLVIVSLRVGTPPPTLMGDWMEEWPEEANPRALLLLLEGQSETAQPLIDYFRNQALKRNMDFLASAEATAGEFFAYNTRLFRRPIQEQANPLTHTRLRHLEPHSTWGINE